MFPDIRASARMAGAVLLLFSSTLLIAQTPAANIPAWDVISVRPASVTDRGMSIQTKPDGVLMKGVSLRILLSNAYGLRSELVYGGPGWLDTARFDIEAKVTSSGGTALNSLSIPQRRLMFQALLHDRFQWRGHTELRQLPVYDLVIAKGGPKIKRSVEGDKYEHGLQGADGSKGGAGMMIVGDGSLIAQGTPIRDLVSTLAGELERDVIDKTGLTGDFDVTLKWTPEDGSPKDNGADTADSAGSIFTAVQEQLGLKLVPSKGPVLTLVVDHMEKPQEN